MGFLDNVFGGRKKEFCERLKEFLENHPEMRSVVTNRNEMQAYLKDSVGSFTVSLDEGYREYLAAEDKDAAVEELASGIVRTYAGVPLSYETAAERVFPYLRQRVYFQVKPLHAEAAGQEPVELPHAGVSDNLAVEVVYRDEGGVIPVSQYHYQVWQKEFSDVLEQAMKNLRGMGGRRWSTPEARVYVSPWRGDFDASMTLFVDLLDEFRVLGKHVVMAPSHNILIVTGSDDQHGLAKMAELTEETIREAPYFLSSVPMILEDNEWVPFQLPPHHRLARRFRILAIENEMRDYTAQKEALEAYYAFKEKRMLVPDYTALDNSNTGDVHSYCIWPNNAPPVLLPKVDRLYFMNDPESKKVDFVAGWDKVMGELGDLVKPLKMFPERYRVSGYPNRQQFEAFSADDW